MKKTIFIPDSNRYMRVGLLPFLKENWVLLLVLAAFIGLKLQHLPYPFYIDEGQVYAPAVKIMAANGPGILPGALPPEYSRGHPLMFHFLCSVWMNCFGTSNVAIHSFPLLVSAIFLVALYLCCKRLFGKEVAVLSLLLVATRVVFFVDSSFVYPEVMLALFTLLSLYFYSRDKLLLTSFSLFMLFFTKEGGLIYGAIIGVDAFVSLFRRDEKPGRQILRIAAVALPVCLIALFFVLQKALTGWYILPEHTGLIKNEWNNYYLMFRRGLYWSFRGDDAMYLLVFFFILLSVVPAVKTKNIGYLFLVPAAWVVYMLAEIFATDTNQSRVWMFLCIAFLAMPTVMVLRLNKGFTAPARKFIVLQVFCILVYLLYSSLTQIGYRYLLTGIILTLIFFAVCVSVFAAAGGRGIYRIAVVGILLIGAYGFYTNDRFEDTQLGAYNAMKVQMHNIDYLYAQNATGKEIAIGCAVQELWYTDSMQGFLAPGRTFTNVKRLPVVPTTEYVIVSGNCGSDEDRIRMAADTMFRRVYRYEDGPAWTELYQRK